MRISIRPLSRGYLISRSVPGMYQLYQVLYHSMYCVCMIVVSYESFPPSIHIDDVTPLRLLRSSSLHPTLDTTAALVDRRHHTPYFIQSLNHVVEWKLLLRLYSCQ